MDISRRKFLASLAIAPVSALMGGSYMRFFEPEWLEETEKTIAINKLGTPIRVLHLSDFHASDCVRFELIESAVDIGIAGRPDICLLTGDFITWLSPDMQEYGRILKKLTKNVPCYACIGNHDGGRWAGSSHGYSDFTLVKKLLESSGVDLLFNEKRSVNVKGNRIVIVGLGDLWSGDCKPEVVLKAERETALPIFVMSHNPDSKEKLADYDWDIMFCGHTHGGQLVVPVLESRPFLPVRDRSFPEGLLIRGERVVHITRGVGNLHGMRFNCRPEVSFLNVV